MPKYELFDIFTFPLRANGGNGMATVQFTGTISAQVGPQVGQLNVMKPDSTVDQIPVQTLSDRSFSVDREYGAGDYEAQVAFPADAEHKACVSPMVSFSIGLADRTVTLIINVI